MVTNPLNASATTQAPAIGGNSVGPTWLIIVNIIIGTCGIVGNALVVVVFVSRAKRTFKNWTQMYILHQSSIDCLTSCLFVSLRVFRNSEILAGGGSREILLCKLWFSEYFLWSLFMVSTYNLVLVSLERYLAIVRPVFHRNTMSRGKVLVTMLIPWMWAFAFQSYWPPIYELYKTGCYPEWPRDWLRPILGLLTFLFEYLLPLLVMLFAYGSIIHKLREMSDRREGNNIALRGGRPIWPSTVSQARGILTIPNIPTQPAPETGTKLSVPKTKKQPNVYSMAKKNVIRTLLAVFTVYVLAWTPTEVEFLLYNLYIIEIDFSGSIYRILSLIVLANMIANPLIYAGCYEDFQRSFMSLWKRCGKNRVTSIQQH